MPPVALPLVRCPRLYWALALALPLGACSLAPPAPAPALALPSRWQSASPPGWVRSDALAPWQQGRWWQLFGEAELDALMARLELGNQNLAQALANVAQAQALLRQSQAQRWPTLGAQLNTQRASASESAAISLTPSWAPDLWGRLGEAVRAQGANVQISQANLAAARLAAQGSLANAYFGLREADAELQLLADIVTAYERALQITENNYRAAQVAQTDVLQAQTTLENARASRAALQRTRASLEHAIALLLGQAPADVRLAPAPWTASLPAIPAALPSELLLRRPDVAAAERAVAAANANIGAARAAWFPSLSLSASVGQGASSLAGLASAPARTWSLGAALVQPIFNAGALNAAIEQAQAAQQAAAASYRQTALAALSQVEDQLTALDALATQVTHTRLAAQAASGAEQRMMNSYRAGISPYTSVVAAQASALNAQRSLLQLQLQQQQASVALIQALGGGWQAPWAQAQ